VEYILPRLSDTMITGTCFYEWSTRVLAKVMQGGVLLPEMPS
jgi:hypothetical protein